ncbi:MAG TPA: acetate kinase [Asticcacaulis sp.]|jgi:acetate kinase|nr:acetate kinase [Asticcacaulis sp.]
MNDTLLVMNAGSSSLKFRLFALEENLTSPLGGEVGGIGLAPVFETRGMSGAQERKELPAHYTLDDVVTWVLSWLDGADQLWRLRAAGHRIVHGGERYHGPARLDDVALSYLRSLEPLAPLHQPHNLAVVAALAKACPDLVQYGCFDTAFHADLPALATTLPLPRSIRDRGVRRYGFHGLSYSWIARCLIRDFPRLAAGRVVAAHLGNGASLCALKDGSSVDTSMGLTALDGLPMGTRCGAIDPGVVLHLQQGLGLGLSDVEHMLYEDSGLKGLSGESSDVRVLLTSPRPEARFALEYFAYRTAQQVAMMAVAMGGIDGLVFTGGIGEHAAFVRDRILARLAFLPPFETHIIAADEESAMAADIFAMMTKSPPKLGQDQILA